MACPETRPFLTDIVIIRDAGLFGVVHLEIFLYRMNAERTIRLDRPHAFEDGFHKIDHLAAMALQVIAPHDVIGVGER